MDARRQVILLSMAASVAGALISSSSAAPPAPPVPPATSSQARFFELRIRPLLVERCFGCHSAARRSGNLRLDSRAALLRGGDTGSAIHPTDPSKSLLIRAIRHEGPRMPPGARLKDAEIAALTEWVKMGAPWPEPAASAHTGTRTATARRKAGADHWAFQPVRRVQPPVLRGDGWSRTPIDRFLWRRLNSEGLTPAPEADRRSLIRRVTLDLHGLPPTPDEVEGFVADASPDAYEKLVDRLLASPRYGERWARHWLDLVRYADSDGYRIDDYRPHAWRYRDYVIQALNEDLPYDRFVQEQLAGDELFPGDPRALVATGYLRHWIYEYNNRDVRGQWTTILNDITDTTGDVFLGLGIQCARCHDHKFDPILQRDYFRLQAFFAPILPREDIPAATMEQRRAYADRLAIWEARTADLRSRIATLEAPAREKAARDAVLKFPPDIQAMINKPAAARAPLEHQLAELAYRQVDYEYGRLETHMKGEAKEQWLALRKQLSQFEAEKPEPLPVAVAVSDVGSDAPPVTIPGKGVHPVDPGYLTLMDPRPAAIPPVRPGTTGRRAALARWITRPENPLTARVIVNRVWQYHFGHGLAANASDFGTLGEPPSHPELLDYLAGWFTQGDAPGPGAPWSLKRLHRLILTSAAYRQSATHPRASQYLLRDPENRLYWRFGVRRLDAEQIRDSILAVSGELDPRPGGPGVTSDVPRRTIYTRVMRNNRDPLLDVFDLPLFFSSAASRDTTTTPVQSLMLINSQMMLLRARALAERTLREAGPEPDRQVNWAYRLLYGRVPTPAESASAVRFLADQQARIDPDEAGTAGATFLRDRIPYRDGQAARLSPGGPQSRFDIPDGPTLPRGDFTIEAFVLPRSVYETAAVRTIAAKWNGDTRAPGWGFGITGKQSRRKPQTLVLQLIGRRTDGTIGEAALFSDQSLVMNKPYYVAAAIRLATETRPGSVSFYLKDLSNDDEPLLTATVEHTIVGGLENTLPLTLGARPTDRDGSFDGLIDDVRLSRGAVSAQQLLYTVEGATRDTVGYWQFEAKPDVFRDSTGNGLDIRPGATAQPRVDPRLAALADFCHALLNSNEFLYTY